ncbi:hypothetical protein Tco_0250437 [Tanacetum coccineum]
MLVIKIFSERKKCEKIRVKRSDFQQGMEQYLYARKSNEYYAPRNPEVLNNSAANTFDTEDTPSSSLIIVEDSYTPQILTTLEEPLHKNPQLQSWILILIKKFKKTLQNLMGILMYSVENPKFEEAESSSNYQDYSSN